VRVLVVAPDADAAECLTTGLQRHGYAVDRVATGADVLRAYECVDLILLDLELPDIDGLEVCRSIRAHSDVPIIAVTSRASEVDRVLGLQTGFDDYLSWPHGFRELLARIEAVMRRARPKHPAEHLIVHGTLRIDARIREVRVKDRTVRLTRKEFDLLYLLASQPEKIVSRKEIMAKVWDDSWASSSRTIDTHVNSLRNKLGAGAWIITVRGIGFRFGHG
jgi:DNA-binding response OmpR family regulator